MLVKDLFIKYQYECSLYFCCLVRYFPTDSNRMMEPGEEEELGSRKALKDCFDVLHIYLSENRM